MLDGQTNDTKIMQKVERFKKSASGRVHRTAYGVVKTIAGDLVVFKNLSDDKIEHASPAECEKIGLSQLPKAMRKRFGVA